MVVVVGTDACIFVADDLYYEKLPVVYLKLRVGLTQTWNKCRRMEWGDCVSRDCVKHQ